MFQPLLYASFITFMFPVSGLLSSLCLQSNLVCLFSSAGGKWVTMRPPKVLICLANFSFPPGACPATTNDQRSGLTAGFLLSFDADHDQFEVPVFSSFPPPDKINNENHFVSTYTAVRSLWCTKRQRKELSSSYKISISPPQNGVKRRNNLTRHAPCRPKPAVISHTITLASRSGPASPRKDFFVPYCSHCLQKGLTNQNPLTAHIYKYMVLGGPRQKSFLSIAPWAARLNF